MSAIAASPRIYLMLFRISFGVFLLVWSLNKILNPAATAKLFAGFYQIGDLSPAVSILLGSLQALVSAAIILAFFKTVAYGLGLAMHAVSTLATLPHLLLPLAEGSNILFMASVPVLFGAIGLFLARDDDTMLSLDDWIRAR